MPRGVLALLFGLKTSVPTKILTRFAWPPSTSSTWSEAKWSGGSTGAFSGFTGAVIAGCSSGGNKSSLFSNDQAAGGRLVRCFLTHMEKRGGHEQWAFTCETCAENDDEKFLSHVTNVCLHRRRWLNSENLGCLPPKKVLITNWLPSSSTWSFTSTLSTFS